MTNIIATMALIVTTNWTDQIHDGRQLGFQMTNHIASISYMGETNQITLKQCPGQFVWGGVKNENGTLLITNGGFNEQVVYKNGQFQSSSVWGFGGNLIR